MKDEDFFRFLINHQEKAILNEIIEEGLPVSLMSKEFLLNYVKSYSDSLRIGADFEQKSENIYV